MHKLCRGVGFSYYIHIWRTPRPESRCRGGWRHPHQGQHNGCSWGRGGCQSVRQGQHESRCRGRWERTTSWVWRSSASLAGWRRDHTSRPPGTRQNDSSFCGPLWGPWRTIKPGGVRHLRGDSAKENIFLWLLSSRVFVKGAMLLWLFQTFILSSTHKWQPSTPVQLVVINS